MQKIYTKPVPNKIRRAVIRLARRIVADKRVPKAIEYTGGYIVSRGAIFLGAMFLLIMLAGVVHADRQDKQILASERVEQINARFDKLQAEYRATHNE